MGYSAGEGNPPRRQHFGAGRAAHAPAPGRDAATPPRAAPSQNFLWAPSPVPGGGAGFAPAAAAILTVSSSLPQSTTMRSSQKATLSRHAAMLRASLRVMMIALSITERSA